MKKPVALLLITLILFNVLGYYGLIVGLRYNAAQNLLNSFDHHTYSEAETITIKVPMNIPYSDDTEYKRVNGEVEYEGEFYRLIKQKISNDTLYVVCIKDVASKQISHTLKDYVKTFTDKSTTENNKVVKNFIKDYLYTSTHLERNIQGWHQEVAYYYISNSYFLWLTAEVIQPPEA